jgi:hypothetical protein
MIDRIKCGPAVSDSSYNALSSFRRLRFDPGLHSFLQQI